MSLAVSGVTIAMKRILAMTATVSWCHTLHNELSIVVSTKRDADPFVLLFSFLAIAGNTYLAGCTDPQYTDSSCPWKSDDFDSQEWVGLIRCSAVNKTADKWAWAGCSVSSDSYTSLERLASCDCTSKATLFVGQQALTRHASLPSSVGGTISWVSGYAFTASETGSTRSVGIYSTSATGAGLTRTTAPVTATETLAAAGGSSSGSSGSLSAGAKAGITVGAIGIALAVAAMAVMMILHRRRRRVNKGCYALAPPEEGHPQVPVIASDGNHGQAPPAYSGYMTELPSDDSVMPKAHGPGSPYMGLTPDMAQSEFGSRRVSMVSELSNDDSNMGVFTSAPQPSMTSIAELPG